MLMDKELRKDMAARLAVQFLDVIKKGLSFEEASGKDVKTLTALFLDICNNAERFHEMVYTYMFVNIRKRGTCHRGRRTNETATIPDTFGDR